MNMIKKNFSIVDQKLFSKISEDFNPIHLDKKWAEKEYPGKIIIYGISILLWAIESSYHKKQIKRIKGNFLHPVFLGENLILNSELINQNQILSLYVENTLVSKFEIFYGEKFLPNKVEKIYTKNILSDPKVLTKKDIPLQKGIVEISKFNFSKIESSYPNSTNYIGKVGIKGLLSISRLIGMYCPGLRSIFSNFDVYFESNPNLINYEVIKTNSLLGFAKIKINGLNVKGEVGSYFTEELTEKNYKKTEKTSKKYANSCALIIGGSGLGRLATNILLEEGAEVFMTSRSIPNKQTNSRYKKNYENFHDLQLDLNDISSVESFLNKLNKPIKSLYYFASPRIFRRRLNNISSEDMHDFLNIYVYKYINLVELLLQKKKCTEKLVIGYPSSTAINEKLPEQFEYYSAKQIGEFACELLKKKYEKINIKIERLPRLNTRQTNSFIKSKTSNNVEEISRFINKVEKHIN